MVEIVPAAFFHTGFADRGAGRAKGEPVLRFGCAGPGAIGAYQHAVSAGADARIHIRQSNGLVETISAGQHASGAGARAALMIQCQIDRVH
ncbi:hypothetical protein B7H23_06725 [Notoacmeibacter marinus]|uniref:Uncharacterized protein n=1 Tax=Notoacmeibacter marinus TaxID=1876515 RepID=A0A231V318_9HYPH|nr:hypothetical protein B7H23_06725 [Notoacmeibacter marinus]